ncbi:hypothetical protein C8R43DRAFT_31912 [Mycena crocata]|nr:hypothetical protein C8R43DRAFT_31912 [Mycena crocata]
MDELLHHCLRELSFDGDLGCNVSRLRDFVVDFYAHSTTTSAQNTDDAFCAFVWSLVVQQPTVIVGTVPDGITSEVWIAPQNSAKKKAREKGEELVEVAPPRLDIVPGAKNRSLDDLKAQYGDNLRIAADPEATYAAITGTHIRFPKMSPMVYSALQIITRGRDTGVSVVELGQRSKYDQKTCFYLVRQLTELDLVVKVRRGGVGSHFCIHKYFFDRSASWKAIRDEETQATEESEATTKTTSTEVPEEDRSLEDTRGLKFSPIDARHLSSMPLVKARIVKLLKASKNLMHASNNMLIAIGFAHPTKTDRRFFASRTRELLEQRIIENVFVPSKRKGAANGGVKCFRLVSADPEQAAIAAQDGVIVQSVDDGPPEEQSGIKMNVTIHKQIITLLEESATVGMTLNQLAAALCQFDKRTIELLLTRAEKYPPPAHLSDLGIAGLMETAGRERRHRYYTIASYHALVAQENLDKSSAGYNDVHLNQVGGFFPFTPEAFYNDPKALFQHQDRDARVVKNPGKKIRKNPILPDGSVKKGRPRKERPKDEYGEEIEPRKKRKRKVDDDGAAGPEPKKGRPSKKQRLDVQETADPQPNSEPVPATAPVPKKRGRRPKKEAAEDADIPPVVKRRGRGKLQVTAPAAEASAAPKKRGRRSEVNSSIPDADEGAEVAGFSVSESPSHRSKRPRLQSPALSASTPLTPLTPDFIPPVATLSTGTLPNSPTSSNSGPILDTLSDELDGDKVDDLPAMVLSPTLLPLPLLDDIAMPDCPNPPLDSTTATIDSTLSGATQPQLRERLSNLVNATVAVPLANKQKVNVSTLRRENELFRVLELLGGILNTQTKELFDAHKALLISLSQAGETTSAPPGTRLDRRTATAAFNNMELRGRVKQMKTTVSGLTGLTRFANIVYLPDVEETKITAFLAEQGRNIVHFPPYLPKAIILNEDTEYGSKRIRPNRQPTTIPVQLLMAGPRSTTGKGRVADPVRADQLFSYNDETIREVLLTERTTLGQMYGFIVGKLIRTREFHLYGLDVFENRLPSPNIVSYDKRIAAFPFFYNDIPVGLYCALVAAIQGSDELSHILASEQERKISVKDLPSSVHSTLQIGRTRGRGRILELLGILRSLGLAIPLEPCVSGTPLISCEANEDHPTSFQEATSDGWSKDATAGAPNYWHFTSSAPLYHWAAAEEKPPFLRDLAISSCADAVQYWDALRIACSDTELLGEHDLNAPSRDLTLANHKAKTIRRRSSWVDAYSFTWHQMYYLNRFVQTIVGQTPLHLDDGAGEKIRNISRTVSAPENVVRDFLANSHATKLVELEKANRRMQREVQSKAMDEETKASLAQKAAEARAHREAKWEGLVQRVHPDPLGDAAAIRLRRVKTQFLQATGTQTVKWERDILQAVHEADMASTVNSLSKKRYRLKERLAPPPSAPTVPAGPISPLPAPPVVANPPEKPIASLIAMQGPLVVEKTRMRNRKAEGGAATESSAVPTGNSGPRTRFHWNSDYTELAKDAFAIIHSRCRTRGKLDYGAIKQVFPGVNKNSVRTHVKSIREDPTMAAYMARLEDHWHELWMKYRGTALLPDDDPIGLKFDLIAHIEFLRKHIDKNALRVGFAQVEEKEKNILPASVEELLTQFDVVEAPGGTPAWDFMWSTIVDENREKRSLRQAFTTRPDDLVLGTENSSDDVLLAESALKMAMGTAQESYDAENASRILHCIGEELVNVAQKNLLSRGVFSKTFKPGSRPGRLLKISDINQNALGGSIPYDTFQDATALEDISIDDQTWREWPLLSTDGDTAALIQLVSDNKVRTVFGGVWMRADLSVSGRF